MMMMGWWENVELTIHFPTFGAALWLFCTNAQIWDKALIGLLAQHKSHILFQGGDNGTKSWWWWSMSHDGGGDYDDGEVGDDYYVDLTFQQVDCEQERDQRDEREMILTTGWCW